MGELFLGKPDDLVLAFDVILQETGGWGEMTVGTAKNCIVFTSCKAWLILRPMTKELDVKFYYSEIIPSERVRKTTAYGKKYAHHIRVRSEREVDEELFDLLRKGHEFSLD
jgi:hypothetical protein